MAVLERFRVWVIEGEGEGEGEGEEEADHGEQRGFRFSLGIRRDREEERNGGERK